MEIWRLISKVQDNQGAYEIAQDNCERLATALVESQAELEAAILKEIGQQRPPSDGEDPIRVTYGDLLIAIHPGPDRPFLRMQRIPRLDAS